MSTVKIVTQEDLDNHPGLVEKFSVGDSVTIPDGGVITDAELNPKDEAKEEENESAEETEDAEVEEGDEDEEADDEESDEGSKDSQDDSTVSA